MAKKKMARRRRNLLLDESENSDIEQFLTSSGKNVELLPESLRDSLTIKTGLEDVLRLAIDAGRPIAVAGTAGSGKSHLLRSTTIPGSYTVIADLAATPSSKWKNLLHANAKSIVAGNEGAFLLGRNRRFPGYDCVLSALHSLKNGVPYVGDGPTVIDAASFSPTQSHAIAKMVTAFPITQFVREHGQPHAAAAWEMLACPQISKRLATIVELASSAREADGFTFRLLWHFVADLVLATKDDIPWYGRIFSSPTEVGEHIRRAFNPRTIPMPHISNRLWHGDINFVRPRIHEQALGALARSVHSMQQAETLDIRHDRFEAISLLTLLALKESPLDDVLRGGTDLWGSVMKREVQPLLQAINRYYSYGLVDTGDDLELWLPHETERRELKPDVQVSMGTARACDFKIVKSLVVANPPPGVSELHGGRFILRYGDDNASLAITKELIDGISASRSHKVINRRDLEYDWRLATFFERISTHVARADRLHIAVLDFKARTGRLLRWQLGAPMRKITG
jgi:hypothetical protein